MVAMMLTYQPILVKGIKDHEASIHNAYGALATFIFTFLVSVVYLIQDAMSSRGGDTSARRRRSGNDYEGVPTGQGPPVLQDYAVNLDLPPSVQDGMYS